MEYFTYYPAIFNQPIRLTNEEPMEVIKDFFTDYHLSEVRQDLWNMVEAALTTDNSNYSEGKSRSGLLFFYDRLEELIEAAFLIGSLKKEKEKRNAETQ